MIRFDKMSSDDVASIVKKVIATAVLIAATIGVANAASWLGNNCKDLQEKNAQLESLYIEKQELEEGIAAKSTALSEIKLEDSTETLSREELVVVLGNCARNSGVSIVGLDSNSAEIDGAVTKYNFIFEIKGTTSQIASTLAGLDSRKLHYAINEMSLRQAGDYLWLQRNFNEQITWWDLSNVTTAGGFQTKVNITTEDIMGDDVMTLYLDLDFIFANANNSQVEEPTSVAEG